MRVCEVEDNKIEIYLSPKEIYDIFGGYEYINYKTAESKGKIHKLLAAAIPEKLLPLDCEQVLIEVRPKSPGCTISLTKVYANSAKPTCVTFIFNNSEQLISGILPLQALRVISSELYTHCDKYALICSVTRFSGNDELHIGEYCKVTQSKADAIRIKEYWQPVCKSEALTKLTVAFLK